VVARRKFCKGEVVRIIHVLSSPSFSWI